MRLLITPSCIYSEKQMPDASTIHESVKTSRRIHPRVILQRRLVRLKRKQRVSGIAFLWSKLGSGRNDRLFIKHEQSTVRCFDFPFHSSISFDRSEFISSRSSISALLDRSPTDASGFISLPLTSAFFLTHPHTSDLINFRVRVWC